MQHVLTLTADPAHRPLRPHHADAAAAALRAAGARHGQPDWLGDGCALDLVFADADPGLAWQGAAAALAGAPVDIAVQPVTGRRKQLLVADMDSTIIEQESLDELAAFAGIREQVAPVTERAMRGEIDFETAVRHRVRLLAGQPADLLTRLVRDRISLTPGAAALTRTMRKHGAWTVLVSGGFTAVTSAVARLAGFDAHHGNRLGVADNRLTGDVGMPLLDSEAKRALLLSSCAHRGLGATQALAVGDGANDIPMIEAAGTGVAFRAKPRVAEAARFRIDNGDLTAVLFLQGYRERDFAGNDHRAGAAQGATGSPRDSHPG